MGLRRCGRTKTARRGGTTYCFIRFQIVLNIKFDLYVCLFILFIKYRNVVTIYTALIQLVLHADVNFFIKLLYSESLII